MSIPMTTPRRTASIGNPGIGSSGATLVVLVCGEDETKVVLVVVAGTVVRVEVGCVVVVPDVVVVLGIALKRIAAEYAGRRTLVTGS